MELWTGSFASINNALLAWSPVQGTLSVSLAPDMVSTKNSNMLITFNNNHTINLDFQFSHFINGKKMFHATFTPTKQLFSFTIHSQSNSHILGTYIAHNPLDAGHFSLNKI